ncbi:hypothetical protein C3L33_04994, partial [Rhododendron williamsianum]
MSLIVPSVEVSSISGRRLEFPACFIPRSVGNQTVLKKNSRGGVRVRVCSRIKDYEVGISELGHHNIGLYDVLAAAPVNLSTTSLPPKKSKEEEEENQDYYVNTGYAIRTLREEFPELFYKELTFNIYREDIVFRDPLNTFVGIENYKAIFRALRFHGRIFFKALWIDIISVWQPVENIIMVRWTVHGIPRVPWERHGRFDGTSEYKLDKHGKIYEHRVHNIALNAPPPKFRVLAVDELLQSIGCSSTPKPTYFEISPSPVMNSLPLLVKLAWVREYLTSIFASSQRHKGGSST